jgi:hypothetical protein
MKNELPSMGLADVGTTSLSTISTSAVAGLPRPTPVPDGFESISRIVSSPSTKRSLMSRIANVLLVSPGANRSTPALML